MNPRFCNRLRSSRRSRPAAPLAGLLLAAVLAACGGGGGAGAGGKGGGPGGPGGGPMAMPVPVATVGQTQVNDATEYVATLKSRHTTNVQPQIDGVITRILVKSGDRVRAGASLMQIDPEKQRAAVHSQEAARAQKQAALDYARKQLQRVEMLYKGGAASKQQLDEAETALSQAKADYEAAGAQVKEQQVQLAYYRVAAPASGVVGDIPVRTGDRVTTSTLLTTIDQNDALEAYISVPIERAAELKVGLPVEVLGDNGATLAETRLNFISPLVDDQTQEVLVKAPVLNGQRGLRAAQFVRVRLVWSTHPGVVVPVLAVTRVNGQYFVFVAEPGGAPGGAGGPGGAAAPGSAGGSGKPSGGAGGPGGQPGGPGAGGGGASLVAHQRPVKVGDMVGNDYVILAGLQPGDRVVASGVQKLIDGMPIIPMPAGSAGPGGAPGAAPGGPGGSGASGQPGA
ncbi:MAG TPA: efflux RND transporter periplasmic adaptor subunit [Thermoanaerobaculia bacterium]|nr:efflux RND transporter periplasmic adaptor subunit [Thermoanaerobaculia bacterium]